MSSPQSQGCIFCEIASGKRPARIVSENENAIAFLDAFPLAEGHLLVIPRFHAAKIQEVPWRYMQSAFELVWKLSSPVERATGNKASTIALHNGRDAGQEIPHVHFHIIPRSTEDGAGPVHTMFKKRPHLSSERLDLISSRISGSLSDGSDQQPSD